MTMRDVKYPAKVAMRRVSSSRGASRRGICWWVLLRRGL